MHQCPICDSIELTKSMRFQEWQVYLCRPCGFRFAADGPVLLSDHYDESYFDVFRQRDESDKWRKIYKERIDYMKANAPGKELLEVGAGASTFAINAADRGFNVTVVDGSEWAIEHLTANNGISGRVVDLNQLDLPERHYHAIHCSHLLEHLSDPKDFLSSCFQGMAKDGLMYLSFPAYEPGILRVRDLCYRVGLAKHPYNYQAPDHLSYFSARCIRQTLTDIGYAIDSFRRTKFISLHYSLERMNRQGIVRKLLFGLSAFLKPITVRLGFHRDLEIIARRPS